MFANHLSFSWIQNIDEVLGRGERIESISTKAGDLSMASKAYLKDVRKLHWMALTRKIAPVAAVSLVALLVIYLRYFL